MSVENNHHCDVKHVGLVGMVSLSVEPDSRASRVKSFLQQNVLRKRVGLAPLPVYESVPSESFVAKAIQRIKSK